MANKGMPTYDRLEQVIQTSDVVINVDTAANLLETSGQSLFRVMMDSPERIPFTYVLSGSKTFRIPRIPFLTWLLGEDREEWSNYG